MTIKLADQNIKTLTLDYQDQSWNVTIKSLTMIEQLQSEKHLNKLQDLTKPEITDNEIKDIVTNVLATMSKIIVKWDLETDDGPLPIPEDSMEFAELLNQLGLSFWLAFQQAYAQETKLEISKKKK